MTRVEDDENVVTPNTVSLKWDIAGATGEVHVVGEKGRDLRLSAIAPAAVARRQIRPPKNAGPNCAIAAKDRSPIWASCASPA